MKTEYQELIKKLSLYIALKSDIIYNAAQTKQNSESEGGGVKKGRVILKWDQMKSTDKCQLLIAKPEKSSHERD
jgi:hypothetical protein